MFSKTRQNDRMSMPTIVSADASVRGDMLAEGDIQVEGKVTGDVVCEKLTLGEAAEINGQIDCQIVHVHGTVCGEIHADTVFVSETARISGDIHHGSISVETGAVVEGRLVRRESKQAPLNLVTDQSATTPAE